MESGWGRDLEGVLYTWRSLERFPLRIPEVLHPAFPGKKQLLVCRDQAGYCFFFYKVNSFSRTNVKSMNC